MSPIYEFKCDTCGSVIEDLFRAHDVDTIMCPLCTAKMHRIPSVPGYRRDHTVVDES